MLSMDNPDLVRNLSVLLVEDEADVRDSLARFLGRRIDGIHTAHNGEAGLSAYQEHRPDLVISDIRMAGMDGLEMCRAIRKIDPELPVIFISAHNEIDVLLSAIDLKVTKFIVKPMDTAVLMETIAGVAESLERRRTVQHRLQQVDATLNEIDYETECVNRYVSRFLGESNHDELPNIRHLNIPKLGVSGDFYSVAKSDDDLYVMLADGAGHGLSAVLPALQIPALFKKQAAQGFSLLTIAAKINASLYEQHLTEHFVATTLVRLNQREGYVEVLNCANPPALIFSDDGVLLHEFHSSATALGMVGNEDFSARVERFKINLHARIYLFTDGLTDTLQAKYPGFGVAELHSLLGSRESPFDELAAKLADAAAQCKADDVTLLELHVDCDGQKPVEIPVHAVPHEEQSQVAMGQMTLLYVEDDELTREYLAHYLNRRLGMVYVAKDGREGLALFIKHRPQIVLSDIKMPLMDGLEMAQEIRRLDRDVPIIVTSGSDNAEDAEKMFEMGISRFYMKPLDPGKLNSTIQACVRHANELNQLRLSASALQTSSLAAITADRDKRIVYVNPAFAQTTGYALEEVQGLSPVMLSAGKYDVNHYQNMWRELDESGSWSGELQCQHKSGETIFEWLTVNAVKGEDDQLTGYHFIFSDRFERQHDSLTRLPNREMLAKKTNELLADAKRLALVCFNIDRFTEINNVVGVCGGDKVLFTFSQRILSRVNAQDLVCRLGGDEFAVMISEPGERESIETVVAGLLHEISLPIDINGQQVQLQVSIGISICPSDGETYDELVKNAYSAMNQAQLAGGNTSRFFDKAISQREERQAILRQDIRGGLSRQEFYMLYQPKYSLSKQRVVGAEALVRWNHPVLGLVSPLEFIPLAESSGAIVDMSVWIIDTVCAQLFSWRHQQLPQVPVSINISPVHFWRGDLIAALREGVDKWAISPEMLPIEVTEGIVMDTSEKTMRLLGELKAMGFHLSIDDFGTGYSSLKYLKDLPVSELKIDRSFIIDIPEVNQPDELSRTAIPRAVIKLAAELDLTVVAEGVETEHQKDFLIANGCDVIQGYWFSRPVPADEFATLLK